MDHLPGPSRRQRHVQGIEHQLFGECRGHRPADNATAICIEHDKLYGIMEMRAKVYMSNISPLWPFERQEPLLEKARAAGFTELDIRKDNLSGNERRAHKIDSLMETPRPSAEQHAQGWRHIDLSDARLRGLVIRRPVRCSCNSRRPEHEGLGARPGSENPGSRGAGSMAEGRRGLSCLAPGEADLRAWSGWRLKSGALRRARVKEAAEQARPFWGLEKPAAAELAQRYGISVSGLVTALGPRKVAQKNYQAALKRKAQRETRPKREEEANAGD